MKYKLINPVIEGKFDSTFEEESSMKAANKCWLKLSKYLSNDVPSFAFTMKEMDGGKLHHYKVKEKKDKSKKKIDFTLTELDLDLSDSQLKRLNDLNNEIIQKGGLCGSYLVGESQRYCNGYKTIEVTPYAPINYWWYWPYLYRDLELVYMPNFIAPLNPYVTMLF